MPGNPIFFTTAVGRIVAGNLYKFNDKDFDGNPLTTKSGPNAGKPRVEYFFALAVPKTPGIGHWSQEPFRGPKDSEPYMAAIWRRGHAFMPNAGQLGDNFAWKVKDGDSTQPDKKGTRWCDKEGYPGHWVLHLSSGYAPKVYNKDGSALILDVDAVKPGYWVQVFGTVDDNGNQKNPGVFLNHAMVSLQGYGTEIVSSGADVGSAAFGQGVALPAGASAVPIGGFTPPVQAPAAAPAVPVPGAQIAHMPAPPIPGVPSTAAPLQPYPGILAVPGAPAAPGAATPPMPPAAPVRQMLGAAIAIGYDAFKDRGWTDEQLKQAGHMA
jgi:hypothetical protein